MQTVPKLGTGDSDRTKKPQSGSGVLDRTDNAQPGAEKFDQRNSDSPNSSERFDVLTGLTFVPLAVICWHHAHDFWQPMQGLLETELTFKHFVTMFFVLSGFVIAFRHNHIKDTATALRFYLDRVAWLWPVHLLCLVSLLFLVPEVFSIKGDQFLPFLSSLFMAQTWIPIAKYYFSFNSPSWTTTTLFAFYAAFPLLLMCARRSKALVLSITAALALGMILVSNSLGLPVDNLTGPSIQGMVYINPLARLLEFTAGIVCALTYLQFAHRIKLSPVFATILEVAALALIAFVNLNSKGWQIQATPLITESGAFWLHHSATSFIPFAIFMTILSTKKGLMAKFFASKTMVFLGKLSFSMFMIHGVVIAFLNVNYRQEQSLTSAVYITAGLLLAAHITHSYFVQPIRRLINKHGQKLIARNFPTPPPSPDRWISAGLDKQNHWLLGIEIVVCAAMIYLAQPTIASVSPEQAATIGATATVKDVHFDPWLKCVSGTARHGNEFVTINTVWQPLKPESIDFFIIARVLDKSNAVLGVKRYSMDGRHQQVSPEQQWLDTVSIAVPADAQPTRVAIKITRGKRKAVAATSNNPSEIDASEMLIPVIAEEVHQIQ